MLNALASRWHEPGGLAAVLRIAWPLIISNSFWTFQLALDRVLLSQHNPVALGAAQAASLLFWTPVTVLLFTTTYSATFVAQYLGAKQYHRVGPAVWQGLYVAIFGGLAFLGLWFAAEPMVRFGGHTAEMQQLEIVYFRCLCFSALPFLVSAGAGAFFAGRGESRVVMLINAVGVLVNAPLTYCWIHGKLGFPAWGIAGAGWATAVGSTTSAILALILLTRRRHREEFRTDNWKPDFPLFGRLLKFGIPNGLTLGLEALAFSLFLLFVGRFGETAFAATSVAFTINLFLYLPTAGIGQGVSVLVGQHLGEDRDDLAARASWSGLIVGMLLILPLMLILLAFPGGIIELFRSHDVTENWELIATTAATLLWFVLLYASFDCLNLIFSFALRGAGDTRFVTWVMLISGWPLLVGPTWLSVKHGWGLYWAWTFAGLYVVFLGTVYLLRFLQGKWRSMRVIEPSVLEPGAAPALELPLISTPASSSNLSASETGTENSAIAPHV